MPTQAESSNIKLQASRRQNYNRNYKAGDIEEDMNASPPSSKPQWNLQSATQNSEAAHYYKALCKLQAQTTIMKTSSCPLTTMRLKRR